MKIRVYGEPAPQGSKTAIVRNGKAIMFESSKKLPGWRDTCLMACTLVANENDVPILGPVTVYMTFHMPRPKSVSRRYPNSAPDLDKLLRACCDSIEQSGILGNDGQIVSIKAHKIYAAEPGDVGVEIEIYPKA